MLFISSKNFITVTQLYAVANIYVDALLVYVRTLRNAIVIKSGNTTNRP